MKTIAAHGGDYYITMDMREFLAGSTALYGDPATPLTGGIGFLSLTEGGTTIDASLSQPMVKATTDTSVYAAALQGSDLATHLDALIGQIIWRCVRFGTDFEEWERVRVVGYR